MPLAAACHLLTLNTREATSLSLQTSGRPHGLYTTHHRPDRSGRRQAAFPASRHSQRVMLPTSRHSLRAH